MTKIGLLSDTHGHLDARVFQHFQDCDEIWHAGDFGSLSVVEALQQYKPLRGVWGNIDGREIRTLFAEHIRFEVENVPVLMTHIGGYPGRYAPRIKKVLLENPPRGGLFISGHSHILKVMPDRELGLLHLNPGACGLEGWHRVKTLIRFSLHAGNISDLNVIELRP